MIIPTILGSITPDLRTLSAISQHLALDSHILMVETPINDEHDD